MTAVNRTTSRIGSTSRAAASAPPRATSTRLLRQGSRGSGVRTVQRALQAQGHGIAIDGVFGPKTRNAVRSFQRQHGLQVDGIVGPQTLGALNRVTTGRPGSSTAVGGTTGPQPTRPGAPGNRSAVIDRTRLQGQRNQMASGRISINGNTYDFNSGGGGRGNLPRGDYRVTPHLWNRSDKSTMMVGGVGYSFALSDKYDARVGGTRKLLRIHPDGGRAGTIGCIGIVGGAATQRRFREDMRAELNRNGGSFTLSLR